VEGGSIAAPLLFLPLLLALASRAHAAEPVTLLFVGDLMLGRHVEAAMRAHDDWSFPFRPLAARLRAADLTFGNLECVTAVAGKPRTDIGFRADPRAVEGLVTAGFDVVSIANTHTTDWGPEALQETLDHLREKNIAYVGLDKGDVQEPVVLKVGALRVGFLAFSHYAGGDAAAHDSVRIALIGGKSLVAAVQAARPAVDYLVVSLHLGKQFERRATEAQQAIARAAIDAGADLVVGHHPHVPQEIEKHGSGFIAYSLGDFVFDHPEVSADGAILEVTLAGREPTRIVYTLTHMNAQFQPHVVSEKRWEGAALRGADGALD